MAKVAMFSRSWNEPARNFALALREQHHEVYILTSKNQNIDDSAGLPILACFEKWNLREAIELIPHLFRINPDIFHFFQTDEDKEITQAHWMMAALGKSIPRRATALSTYRRFSEEHSKLQQLFVRLQDLVTVGNRENLMFLRRNHWLGQNSLSEIIPPFTSNLQSASDSLHEDPEIQKLIESIHPFVLVPGSSLPDFLMQQLYEVTGLNVLFFGNRSKRELRKHFFYLDRSVFSEDFAQFAKASKACVTAGLELSLLELVQLQKNLWQARCPLICDPHQAEALPGLCLNGQNGFVHQEKPISSLLQSCQDLKWSESQHLVMHGQLKDLAMNELARLYSKALQNAAQSLR